MFLDEIAEMPLDLQPYLLRVLEGGELYRLGSHRPRTVRFRLLAASNRNLRAEVSAARFRIDLFYRVSLTSLHIPPLRERPEDVPSLIERLVREISEHHRIAAKRFAPAVLLALGRYGWPGNVRELRNVVEAMLLLAAADVVDLTALPAEIRGAPEPPIDCAAAAVGGNTGLEGVERDAIKASIRAHRGNLTKVARHLRISKSTLYLKMKRYALEPVVDEVRLGAR